MDYGIPQLATAMAATEFQSMAGILTLKKANEAAPAAASQLIDAVQSPAPAPTSGNPPNLGQNIDVSA
ncbi:MAG: YjfB family protein [Chromatiales bacterium]|jgi:hypothetical protein|nr:YjfB family protein [Chromatiales bacterium]MDX9768527.1 YjfB family protein [Ectothiorhodospiraceae bacterium]